MSVKKLSVLLGVLVVVSMVLTACPAPQPQVIEKIVTQVVEKEVKVVETQVVEKQVEVEKIVTQQVEVVKEVAAEDFTTPHPILSDVRVRQAIASCINRDELIASVYSFVDDKAALRMDSFLPKTHWAYKGPYQDYPFDPVAAGKLLDDAGWKLKEGDTYRTNDKGDTLALKFTTTTSAFRQTWAAVAEQDLLGCGVQLIRQHVPASWWFGDSTGLKRRDYELGAFAWVGQTNPQSRTLYACNQIPLPSNNWEGQNGMGWCNEKASNAAIQGDNNLKKEDRVKWYDILQQEFAKDMVSLPLFQRAEGDAWSKNLEGMIVDPTEYVSASAADWTMKKGDTVIFGFTQEPSTLYQNTVDAAVAREVGQLIGNSYLWTQYNYDFQPLLQDPLSTIENNLASNTAVDVKAGDMVYNISGNPVKLEKGTKLFDFEGNQVEYDGSSPLKMNQLAVTYKLKPFKWSDGVDGSVEDMKLSFKQDCDKESGATSFIYCDAILNTEFGTDLSATVTYVPGFQDAIYYVYPFYIYPSHLKLADGRMLADVPAKEWSTLTEIAEKPLGWGPFMVEDWKKGESMTLVANPYADPAPKVKKVIVKFIPDTNQAVAQLLSGDVDILDTSTLAGGAEMQTVLDAAKAGKVNAQVIASPTWEHIDMNLFTK